jgi:hypothetical protein
MLKFYHSLCPSSQFMSPDPRGIRTPKSPKGDLKLAVNECFTTQNHKLSDFQSYKFSRQFQNK